jgi:hypothetical protein
MKKLWLWWLLGTCSFLSRTKSLTLRQSQTPARHKLKKSPNHLELLVRKNKSVQVAWALLWGKVVIKPAAAAAAVEAVEAVEAV